MDAVSITEARSRLRVTSTFSKHRAIAQQLKCKAFFEGDPF